MDKTERKKGKWGHRSESPRERTQSCLFQCCWVNAAAGTLRNGRAGSLQLPLTPPGGPVALQRGKEQRGQCCFLSLGTQSTKCPLRNLALELAEGTQGPSSAYRSWEALRSRGRVLPLQPTWANGFGSIFAPSISSSSHNYLCSLPQLLQSDKPPKKYKGLWTTVFRSSGCNESITVLSLQWTSIPFKESVA